MFKIFNQRLAGFLMMKGFKLVSVEPNKNIKDFNIFTFEKSNRLDKAISQYQEIKKIYSLRRKTNEKTQNNKRY